MNQEDHDPLLDAFLEEALGQSAPPDLSDRIVRAWRESQAAEETHAPSNGSLSGSSNGSSNVPVAPPTPPPHPIAAVVHRKRSSTTRKSAWPRYVISLAVALAILTIYIAAMQDNDPLADNDVDPDSPTPKIVAPETDGPSNPKVRPTRDADRIANTEPDKKSAFDEPTPFENKSGGATPGETQIAKKPERMSSDTLVETINGQLTSSWAVHALQPAEMATDAEFCRRLFLAMIGRIPTVQELDAFLERDEANKRAWLVDRLQNHEAYRPYYVANWTNFWTTLLIGRTGGQKDSLASREGLAEYLEDALTQSKPYDQIVRELLTASGDNQPGADGFNGAVNFLLDGYTRDTTLAASRTARIFLGKQIQCVQCHNHPTIDGVKQHRFWEYNAFFRQMRVKRGKQGLATLRDETLVSESRGSEEAEIYYEQLDGLKRVAFPRFFDGQTISKNGDIRKVNRREKVAQFIVNSKDFSRAAVNRLWARFFQYGLSNPVDDMGDHAQPQHPELLDLLAEQFEANDYDLDKLIGWIAMTDAFGRSSKTQQDNLADNPRQGAPLFSRYYTRQLSPEAVYDSLLLAAKGRTRDTGATETVGDYVKAQRAWVGEFSKNMKTDEGQETDTFSGDIRQSVVVMTSPLMKQAVSNQLGGVLNQVTSSSMPIPEKIEHLFMAALSRKPTTKEMLAVRKIIDPRNPNQGLQDIWWALLNSNEFILDH